ncbi:rplD [Symbiodinium sp. CCMP2592]|nr:rplD [Symbiodinium sp. CCMP2592]
MRETDWKAEARLTVRRAVPTQKRIPVVSSEACKPWKPLRQFLLWKVVNLAGQKIGVGLTLASEKEELQLRTFSRETANYCVHQAHTIYKYQQLPFTAFIKRRSDMKKGKKLWKNKGVGKARMGTIYSPLWGKSATNKNRHGLDDRKKKFLPRLFHCKAISTVLQSKWRCMKIVEGLEDHFEEPRYYELSDMVKAWTGMKPGIKQTLMITRSGYGEEHKYWCLPTKASFRSPLYMAGRLIENFSMRRPRDMDPDSDGLHQALLGRRVIISREAFFDLKAKFDAHNGWAFKSPKKILVEQMQDLVKEYPYDREAEFEAAREVPKKLAEREFWAKKGLFIVEAITSAVLGKKEQNKPASEFSAVPICGFRAFGHPVLIVTTVIAKRGARASSWRLWPQRRWWWPGNLGLIGLCQLSKAESTSSSHVDYRIILDICRIPRSEALPLRVAALRSPQRRPQLFSLEQVVDVDVEDEEDEEELSISEEAQLLSIAVTAVVIFASAELWFSISWYNKTKYKVFSDGMYEIAKTGETGEWSKYFKMPQSEVERRKPKLMFEYFKKIRKWRRKMGMCRYPNGHLKFIVMMKDHPFTREIYGDKYADTPKWIYNKGEVKRKEMVKRARKLELMLRREDEERRLDRLREMGVWTGEPSWHRDAERDMRWRPRHAKGAWR